MRVLDLDGTARERGRAQGEASRDALRQVLDDLFASEVWREHGPTFVPRGLVTRAVSVAGRVCTQRPVGRLTPAQAQRVRGLGEGLGIRHGFAWGLQFLEIVFCEAGSSLAPPGPAGCTVVQALPGVTTDGHVLTGRNYDFPRLLQPYQIVRREVPREPDRLATMTVTQAPLAGAHQGINVAGLVVSANNARLWRGPHLKYRGVPFSLLVQDVLETCRTAAQALQRIQASQERANAGFIAVCDPSGDAFVVEMTARDLTVRRPVDGVLAQANHFHELTHANLPEGTRWTVKGMEHVEYLAGSRARQIAAKRALDATQGRIDVATLQEVLRDHAGGPGGDDTVCAHGLQGGTLSSFVIDATDRRMWVANGNPCEAPFHEIAFRER